MLSMSSFIRIFMKFIVLCMILLLVFMSRRFFQGVFGAFTRRLPIRKLRLPSLIELLEPQFSGLSPRIAILSSTSTLSLELLRDYWLSVPENWR